MNIIHFALVHVLNNEYYNRTNDEYMDSLLQTIYLREGNFGIVELINHIEQRLYINRDSDNEEEIYSSCSLAVLDHIIEYRNKNQ